MHRAIPFCLSVVVLLLCSNSYSQDIVSAQTTPDSEIVGNTETMADVIIETGPDTTPNTQMDTPAPVDPDTGFDTSLDAALEVIPDATLEAELDFEQESGPDIDYASSTDDVLVDELSGEDTILPPLEPTLKGLIVTSPGVYHNYEQQTRDLARGIVEHVNIRFDVSLAEPQRWKNTDYAEGYDVVIYNICMADNQDAALIANMRRQTEELGVPALIIHCTVHSFRNTELWWPLFGLKSRTHEPLRPLRQIQSAPHPVLTGVPEDWVLSEDELYTNLDFIGESLLTTVGQDGDTHTTAWVDYQGLTPIFGTTLGHSEETMKNTVFQRLIANAVLFVTGNLSSDGQPLPSAAAVGDGMYIFDKFSAPEGVKFLGRDGQSCALRKIALAAAPCYAGCILNPFEWGEETRACKTACEVEVPSSDALIKACSPAT